MKSRKENRTNEALLVDVSVTEWRDMDANDMETEFQRYSLMSALLNGGPAGWRHLSVSGRRYSLMSALLNGGSSLSVFDSRCERYSLMSALLNGG